MATVLSLKGKSGVWGGISETSEFAPAQGTFRRLEGAVPSRDGTELHFAPGGTLCGNPFYGQSFVVTVKVVGVGMTTLTVDATADRDGDAYLPEAFWVYVPADGLVYGGLRTGDAEFRILTEVSAVAVGGYVLIQRRHAVHDMAMVDGRAAIVLETTAWRSINVQEQRNLATMVCGGALSTTSPPGPGIPDETDAGFVLWPSPTAFPMNTTEYGHDEAVAHYLRHYNILRRMQCDAINGRLLIAVPGLGIMFEANVRLATQWMPRDALTAAWQPDIRWTRMLGIPRGVLSGAAVPQAGGGGLTVLKWYAFAVAYFNPLTNELGLMSPLRVVQLTGANNSFDVEFLRPRGAMAEAVGLQSIVYLAGPFDDELSANAAQLDPKLYASGGPFPTAVDATEVDAAGALSIITQPVVTEPEDSPTVRPRRPGIIEVNPPGASWVRAVRGRGICGGELPAYWDIAAWPHTEVVITGEPAVNFLVLPNGWNPITATFFLPDFGPAALRRIPPSFAGRIIAQIEFATNSNGGIIESLANAKVNTFGTSIGPTALRVDFNPGTTAVYNEASLKRYRIHARRQATNFTEEDHFGIASSISELPVDSLSDKTTTAGSRLSDNLLIHTKRQTVLFGWAAMPRMASSQVLSNTDGCVSAHSVVEIPGGSVSFADRGPMLWPSGQWIGMGLADLWDSFLRDSEDMVICCGGAYDRRRNLVLWGVRRSTGGAWATADTDAKKAVVPCDTILCWHTVTRAWSVISRTDEQEFDALKPMVVDGEVVPVISSAGSLTSVEHNFWPLYALVGDTERGAATNYTITTLRDPSARLAETGSSVPDCLVGDRAFIRSADGSECKWFGLSGGDGTTGLLCGAAMADANGATWGPGDVLVTRPAYQLAQTHRLASYHDGDVTRVSSLRVIAEVGDGVYAYCRITATAPGEAGVYLTEDWGMRLNDGSTEATMKASGKDVTLTIEVVADGFVAIKDVLLGVE